METNSYTDELLVKRFLDGDSHSFDELISKYQVLVFSLAVNLLGSEERAAEVVKEVFVELSRKIKRECCASFETLVHRTTYDLSLNKMMMCFGDADPFDENNSAEQQSSVVAEQGSKCWFSFGEPLPEILGPNALNTMPVIGYISPSIIADSIDDPEVLLS